MNVAQQLKEELGIRLEQVEAAVELLDQGNTIPFIARYRKEATGALDDEILRKLEERLQYLRNLEQKKQQVIASIAEQGKLTKEYEKQIAQAGTLVEVEDLYRPYRPKRRTRATIAKEKGLEPFAAWILLQETADTIEEEAKKYCSEEKEVYSTKEAIAGAKDIIAEQISDEAAYRTYIRKVTWEQGKIISTAKNKEQSSVYEMYYEFEEDIAKIAGYRVLALNRGVAEKILTVKITAPTEQILRYLEQKIGKREDTELSRYLQEVIQDAYERLIAPAIEREIHNALTEKAEEEAIQVFGKNLTQLLMQPPMMGKVILGWDPAFRTGCKLAVIDGTGKVLETAVIYPTAPQNKVSEAKKVLHRLVKDYQIELIALGNGTASRESEQIIVAFLKECPTTVQYIIVNEAGASVYSASELATEEFPNFDVGQRSAASIARRLQDPLAELVKIDPKSIGVGQYQHDMNQRNLMHALSGVVENCVNQVGVNLNTASVLLLQYVSGITKTIAKNIVAYREKNGRFLSRKQLLEVDKLGPKAFQQCAGFLRITEGTEPLDATSVHPEAYDITRALLKKLGYQMSQLTQKGLSGLREKMDSISALAAQLGVGELTLEDITKELEKPGRDPREKMPKPILRTDVLELTDLKPEMILKGTVRNVIDFGAFVDIGVHQDGLVHISKLTKERFVKHPLDVVHVGDIVTVKVLQVDIEKKRIQLSMIL